MPKRSRSRSRGPSKVRAVLTGIRNKNARRVMSGRSVRARLGGLSKAVSRLTRSIETKEGQWTSASNIALPHNNITLVNKGDGGPLNPFQRVQNTGDPMDQNGMATIGDQIMVKGMSIRGFFEGALQRSKVYFRVMLVKFARGDTPTRATLFKNDSDNKMLDVVNTERYTVVWQKIFTVTPPNAPPNSIPTVIPPTGVPDAGTLSGITGNRIIKAWIPGSKFGKGGNVQYENGSTINVKFFDYRFFVLAYDWFGTPQDVNNVGRINSMFSKVYFKDA